MLGVDGNKSNQVVEISPSKTKLGGTGGLEKVAHKRAEKGSDGKFSPVTKRQVKGQEFRGREAGGRPEAAAAEVADEALKVPPPRTRMA